MSLQKRLKKNIVDPESTEWLFDRGYIRFVVDEEGLDIRVTASGAEYLKKKEIDVDLLNQPELKLVRIKKRFQKDLWLHLAIGCAYIVLFIFIMISKTRR
jgi:hypothetical protein